MIEVIAYTYDADIHCIQCTEERFGLEVISEYVRTGKPTLVDSELNPIHAVFDISEHDPLGEFCGTCRDMIYPPLKWLIGETNEISGETHKL